jgi:hypothetical protein
MFRHLEDQLSSVLLFALDVDGFVLPTDDITHWLVDHPFRAFEPIVFLSVDSGIPGPSISLPVGVFVLFLDLGRLHQFNRPTVPDIDIGLMTRPQSRTGTRIYAVIVVQGVLHARMYSEISPRP